MEEQRKPTEKLIETAGNIVETYRDLVTVSVVEHASLGASVSLIGILNLIFVLFVLLFAGLGSAWWVGENLNNMKAGFFIVGSFFVLLLLITLLTARKILVPQIRNLIIKKIYDQNK